MSHTEKQTVLIWWSTYNMLQCVIMAFFNINVSSLGKKGSKSYPFLFRTKLTYCTILWKLHYCAGNKSWSIICLLINKQGDFSHRRVFRWCQGALLPSKAPNRVILMRVCGAEFVCIFLLVWDTCSRAGPVCRNSPSILKTRCAFGLLNSPPASLDGRSSAPPPFKHQGAERCMLSVLFINLPTLVSRLHGCSPESVCVHPGGDSRAQPVIKHKSNQRVTNRTAEQRYFKGARNTSHDRTIWGQPKHG